MKILVISWKEIIHILRDIRVLYFSLIWPILLLLLFGYAVRMDVENINLLLVDLDYSNLSREIYSIIKNTGYFNINYEHNYNLNLYEKGLKKGIWKGIVIIPSGFEKKILRREKPEIDIIIDGCDYNTANVLKNILNACISKFILKKSGIKMNIIDTKIEFLYNKSMKSQNFIIPGLIAIIIMVICTLITSTAIASEWEKGTMEQLMYTPLKSYELILGKLFPYLILGFFQVTTVLITGILIFKVKFEGNIFLFYFASLFYIIGALGTGLYISFQTKSQQISTMIAFLTSILPSFLLSGFIFPIRSMPPIIRFISYLIPARYYLKIIRSIFLKGSGFFDLYTEFIPLIIYSLFFILLSITKFRKLTI